MPRRSLRETLLDVVNDRDDLVKAVAEDGAAVMREALARVVVAMVPAGVTEVEAQAAMQSPEFVHAMRLAIVHAALRARAQGQAEAKAFKGKKGRDEGPILREHLDVRRAAIAALKAGNGRP